LQDWLMAYRPAELFDSAGRAVAAVRRVLAAPRRSRPPAPESPRGCVDVCANVGAAAAGTDFSNAVTGVLRRQAAGGGFRLFSPDELASNRIALPDHEGRTSAWAIEVLNEEICHAWAQGYTETGRRTVVATYEAFAPIASSLIAQHLKYRRLARRTGRPAMPSIVYLITSLGWNNSYTHQNPGLVSAVLALEDPSVHVLTPADAPRTAASLAFALRKLDCCTLIVAGKHSVPEHPQDALPDELRHGLAIWPHLSDTGAPDLVLAAAGDLPVREMAAAVHLVRTQLPNARLRFVAIHDLTALGDPQTWQLGLPADRFGAVFGTSTPVLVAVPFFRDTVRSLLWSRPNPDRFTAVGYVDPGRPASPAQLLHQCGMDSASLAHRALALLRAAQGTSWKGEQPCTADPIAI
jgi:xylulose-5-phosphate/fructose-6-phosphate phosphoketolase